MNFKKVQVGKDQEKARSEKKSHFKNRGEKKQTNNQVLIRGMFFNTCHLHDYFFCGQSMRMVFICGESPIFSDQIGIKIIAVRRTVI